MDKSKIMELAERLTRARLEEGPVEQLSKEVQGFEAADAYKINGSSTQMEPFVEPKGFFWAQKCILESRIRLCMKFVSPNKMYPQF